MEKPAIFGGKKEFDTILPIVKPALPQMADIQKHVEDILTTGLITNFSKYVVLFEDRCKEYLGVKFALAQSNGTSGLLLTYKSLGLAGEVIMPSFTFSATGHALVWNNINPVFVDIEADTFNIDPKLIESKITAKTTAIVATHIFGNPCKINELQNVANKYNLKLIFDAAHAFGSEYQGKKIGVFGNAEVFSLSATKLLVTGEGGMVTTNDEDIYANIKRGRNYGDPGDYNCTFIGYNSKMQEFSGILGLEGIKSIDKQVRNRNILRKAFIKNLREVNGITFQKIDGDNISTFKDFAIVIDEKDFGIDRNKLVECLSAENIHTKKYFYPPLHRMDSYTKILRQYNHLELKNTDTISDNIICLPIHSYMSDDTVNKICHAIQKIHYHAHDIK